MSESIEGGGVIRRGDKSDRQRLKSCPECCLMSARLQFQVINNFANSLRAECERQVAEVGEGVDDARDVGGGQAQLHHLQ